MAGLAFRECKYKQVERCQDPRKLVILVQDGNRMEQVLLENIRCLEHGIRFFKRNNLLGHDLAQEKRIRQQAVFLFASLGIELRKAVQYHVVIMPAYDPFQAAIIINDRDVVNIFPVK